MFLIAPIVRLNLDVAHGLNDGDTRVHLALGVRASEPGALAAPPLAACL